MSDKTSQVVEPRAFTFEVNLIVQVFGDTEEMARTALDQTGGFVSKRETRLIDTTKLSNGSGLTLIKG